MNLKRGLISLCLLISYSVGLAHDIIPHCHHSAGMSESFSEHSSVHDHSHHDHDAKESADHRHIVHEDHFDDGVFNLLICILSEAEHPSSHDKNCLCVAVTTNDINVSVLVLAKFAGILTGAYDIYAEDAALAHSELVLSTAFFDTVNLNSPLRGPPSIS